jgi:hypothetical protein
MIHNNRGELGVGAAGAGAAGAGAAGAGAAGAGAAPAFSPEGLNALQGDAFRGLFPEEIRTQGYMKDVNTFGDFIKKFDGAQKLIGKSPFPDANATDEQWMEFFSKAGRPATAAEYKIDKIEGIPDEYLENAKETQWMKDLLHASGITQVQMKKFMPGFIKGIYAAEQAEKTQGETEHSKLMDEMFGKDKEEILTNGKAKLAAVLPENLKPFVEKLDSTGLGLVLAFADHLSKQTGEDKFRGGGAGGSVAGTDTAESIKLAMMKIYQQKEFSDPFINKAKHTELTAQMQALEEKLRKILQPKT